MPTQREARISAERLTWAAKVRRGEGGRATSVHAFSLHRVTTEVLSRGTDVASSQLVVDARSEGYERRPISRHERPHPPGVGARANVRREADLFARRRREVGHLRIEKIPTPAQTSMKLGRYDGLLGNWALGVVSGGPQAPRGRCARRTRHQEPG